MDLLLSRYSDINYVMELDLEFGLQLIVEATRQKARDEAYLLYVAVYPNMTKESFTTFDKFFPMDRPSGRQRTMGKKESAEEVITKVDKIMENTTWEVKR